MRAVSWVMDDEVWCVFLEGGLKFIAKNEHSAKNYIEFTKESKDDIKDYKIERITVVNLPDNINNYTTYPSVTLSKE